MAADDTLRMLRAVSPLNDWLPGLNVRHRIVYDSVLDVMFGVADSYMDQAFVARQMRAIQGLAYCPVDRPSRNELLETVSNSYPDQMSAFVECCLNRKRSLYKTIIDRIDALNIPNAYQLKHELSAHVSNKPSTIRSPFSDYLKKLQKCYPDLSYMTQTLTRVEVKKGNLTHGDFVWLHAEAMKDAGIDTVEHKVTESKYDVQARLERAVDRLVACVISKYRYAKLEEFGQRIAFFLIPICRFQEKHGLWSDEVELALRMLSRAPNPALILAMDPDIEKENEAIPICEPLDCPEGPNAE